MGAPVDSVLCSPLGVQVNVDSNGRVFQRAVAPTMDRRITESVKELERLTTQSESDSGEESVADDASSTMSSSSKHARPHRSTRSKARPGLRKGKWSAEEEEYAQALSHYFKVGILPLRKGTMLRLYLADQLNCEPMRITKKFTGDDCIGKQVFRPCVPGPHTDAERLRALNELCALRERFLSKTSKPTTGNKRKLNERVGEQKARMNMIRPSIPNDFLSRPTVSLMTGGNAGSMLTPMHSSTPTASNSTMTLTFTSTPKIVRSSPTPTVTASSSKIQTVAGHDETKVAQSVDTNAGSLLLGFFHAVNQEQDACSRMITLPSLRNARPSLVDCTPVKRRRLGSSSAICA